MSSADVAFELPTGSGKTLVGLLLAEWRRLKFGKRVVYACPTKQLARQVFSAAQELGIPAQLLIGRSANWDPRSFTSFTRVQSIAVTTYSAIFNINSRFGDCGTLLFDDAHAAEQYVAEAWAVKIPRSDAAFADLFDELEGSLDEHFASRMGGNGSDSLAAREVSLLPLSVVDERLVDIDTVLSTALTGDSAFRFSMIRASLQACLFYVSRASWYVRPMIPPTFDHTPYTTPAQRIYLSATLGEAGELERAFGQETFARVPVPPEWERTGSGRRLFVFPQLADPSAGPAEVSKDLVQSISSLSPKNLILSPDAGSAEALAEHLGVNEQSRFFASTEGAVEQFRTAPLGALLAPSRYDGMDLPGDTCRLLFMVGMPSASHLQDQFLSTRLRANQVLAERTRTRIVQGVGRCTRGPGDWAVVVMWGHELLRYMANPDNTKAMPPELQAELEFGLRVSETASSNIVAVANSALAQDANWRGAGEVALAELRHQAVASKSAGADALSIVAPLEVKAWRQAWSADWGRAAETAAAIVGQLGAPSLSSYCAMWSYLASAWESREAANGVNGASDRALHYLKFAHTKAGANTWLRHVQPLPAQEHSDLPEDDAAVRSIYGLVDTFKSPVKFNNRTTEMLAALGQEEASRYERGLVELGTLLGATSEKPSGKGRADATWVWPSLWITVEAKSEQTADRLSMEYVRKANSHLDSLSGDLGVPIPAGSISVFSCTTLLVDKDAVQIAHENLFMLEVAEVVDVARDAVRAWNRIRSSVSGIPFDSARELIAKILFEQDLLPSQLATRMSIRAVRSAG